jgi:hypothetical protein
MSNHFDRRSRPRTGGRIHGGHGIGEQRDYVYQAATVAAVILLLLSAAL